MNQNLTGRHQNKPKSVGASYWLKSGLGLSFIPNLNLSSLPIKVKIEKGSRNFLILCLLLMNGGALGLALIGSIGSESAAITLNGLISFILALAFLNSIVFCFYLVSYLSLTLEISKTKVFWSVKKIPFISETSFTENISKYQISVRDAKPIEHGFFIHPTDLTRPGFGFQENNPIKLKEILLLHKSIPERSISLGCFLENDESGWKEFSSRASELFGLSE